MEVQITPTITEAKCDTCGKGNAEGGGCSICKGVTLPVLDASSPGGSELSSDRHPALLSQLCMYRKKFAALLEHNRRMDEAKCAKCGQGNEEGLADLKALECWICKTVSFGKE